MEAKDLMIGDWIHLLKNRSNIKGFDVVDSCPRRVTAINTDGDEPYVQTDDCDVFYDMSAYQPIVLNERILLDSGFTSYSGGAWVYYSLNSAKWFDLYRKEFGYTLHVGQSEILIEYVHQLQHALRFCGIDKEIIL